MEAYKQMLTKTLERGEMVVTFSKMKMDALKLNLIALYLEYSKSLMIKQFRILIV